MNLVSKTVWLPGALVLFFSSCDSLTPGPPVEIYSSDEVIQFDEMKFPITQERYRELDAPIRGLINYLVRLRQEEKLHVVVDDRPILGGTEWIIQDVLINDSVGRSVAVTFEDGHHEKTVHFIYRLRDQQWIKVGSNTTARPTPILQLEGDTGK